MHGFLSNKEMNKKNGSTTNLMKTINNKDQKNQTSNNNQSSKYYNFQTENFGEA